MSKTWRLWVTGNGAYLQMTQNERLCVDAPILFMIETIYL